MGKEIWLAAGLGTPFTKIVAGLAARDEVGLGVPVVQAMAGQLRPAQRIDFALWGSVIPNLVYSNVGREIWFDAKLDATVPAATSVMACGSSIVAVFQAAGLIAAGASERRGSACAPRALGPTPRGAQRPEHGRIPGFPHPPLRFVTESRRVAQFAHDRVEARRFSAMLSRRVTRTRLTDREFVIVTGHHSRSRTALPKSSILGP